MVFNQQALGAASRRLSEAVFRILPQLRQHASMMAAGEADGLSLVLKAPSPSGDPGRQLVIWVDEIRTPSIGFGPDHTHESDTDEGVAAVVDRARAILEDQILIIEDVGGQYPGHSSWIDLRNPDALEEELTSRYSPGRAILKSWSGSSDRDVSTESLQG